MRSPADRRCSASSSLAARVQLGLQAANRRRPLARSAQVITNFIGNHGGDDPMLGEAMARPLLAGWLYLHSLQCLNQIIQRAFWIKTVRRTKAAPKIPTNTFENAL